jgi:hypothetical protein
MRAAITYQKKMQLILWGTLILFILCYLLAFRKTIDEKKTLTKNRTLSAQIENSSEIHGQLLKELSSIESGLTNVSATGRETQEIIIELINSLSLVEKIKLIDMPGLELADENGMDIINQAFTVQGDFFSLLRFVRSLEEAAGAGKISSADFYRYTDTQSGFSATRVKVYLQNIKMNVE